MVGAIAPEDILIHHFSIGSRASRTAYALPGRMALVYHNITPPHYFIGVHKDLVKLCFEGRRELTAYVDRCDLALGDSEYNRRELAELGFRNTGVLPVVPDFTHLDVPPARSIAEPFDDELDQRAVCRPGDPEQEVRERHPRVPRVSHRSQPARAAAVDRLLQRLRTVPRDAPQPGRAAGNARRALPRTRHQRGVDRPLRRRRSLPLRQRARGVLRSDHRSVLQTHSSRGLRGHRRAGDDGWRGRALRQPRPGRHRQGHGRHPGQFAALRSGPCVTGRGTGAPARQGFRGNPARLRRCRTPGAAAAGSRGDLGLLGAVRSIRSPRGAAAVQAGAVQGPAQAAAGRR